MNRKLPTTLRTALAGAACLAMLAGGASAMAAAPADTGVDDAALAAALADDSQDTIDNTVVDEVESSATPEMIAAQAAAEDEIAAQFDAAGMAYTREVYEGVNFVEIAIDAPDAQWQIIEDTYAKYFGEGGEPKELAAPDDDADASADAADESPAFEQAFEDELAAFLTDKGVEFSRVDVEGVSVVDLGETPADSAMTAVADFYLTKFPVTDEDRAITAKDAKDQCDALTAAGIEASTSVDEYGLSSCDFDNDNDAAWDVLAKLYDAGAPN